MARLADGDRASFAEVYESLWPVMRAFCQKMLGSNDDAQDAAQQALLKVFDRASTFDPARDALTWALTLAAWECRTIRRSAQRRRSVPLDDDAIALGRSPESAAIARDLEATAQSLLESLSVTDRAALVAMIEDNDALHVSGATMRKRRERALSRIRAAWRKIHGS